MTLRSSLLLLSFLLLLSEVSAITWIGGSGSWEVAANWDTVQVPNSTDEVIIPSGKVYLNSITTVARVDFQSGYLIINSGAELQIETPNTPSSLLVGGKLIINGTLRCRHLTTIGVQPSILATNAVISISNSGLLHIHNAVDDGLHLLNSDLNNRGQLLIEDLNGRGLHLEGSSLINHELITVESIHGGEAILIDAASGFINYDDVLVNDVSFSDAVVNFGDLRNSRDFVVQNCTRRGIENNGTLRNYTYGQIHFEQINSQTALWTEAGSNTYNWGTIESVNSVNGSHSIKCAGVLYNYSNGLLDMLAGHSTGIDVSPSGEFHNYGTITIAPPGTEQRGITTFGEFVNYSSGQIIMDGTFIFSGLRNVGVFNNEGLIDIHTTGDDSFSNLGDFGNKGEINIVCDNPGISGEYFINGLSASFTNDGGTIIGRTPDNSLGAWSNNNVFINANCGLIDIEGKITSDFSGDITNDAWIISNSGTPHDIPAGDFTNNGVVEDLQGAFAGLTFTNNGLVADPLPSPLHVGDKFGNALNISASTTVTVDGSWMSQASSGATTIASYDQGDNVVSIDGNAFGLDTFFLDVSYAGCSRWIRVVAPGGVQSPLPFSAIIGNDREMQYMRAYPNPGPGLVQLSLPGSDITSDFHWTVINLQGQIVATGQWRENVSPSLDLQHLPAGTYLLQAEGSQGEHYRQQLVIQH